MAHHLPVALTLVLALTLSQRALATTTERSLDLTNLCGAIARTMERREGIPPGLMQAVALAETGRWLPEQKRSAAWPWTVTSASESYVLDTKDSALATVRSLQARGRTNIDVGCVQINLRYHGHAFDSLEEALDPVANVSYGASFLKRLRAETRSWSRATARYHSSDPVRGNTYRTKVYRLWAGLRRDSLRGRTSADLDGGPPTVAAPNRQTRQAPGGIRRMRMPGVGGSEGNPGAIGIAILRGGRVGER